jgi:hypothetical protein
MAGGVWCMQSLREIHQRALRHVHQRGESAEGGSGYNEPFEQRHGSSIACGPEPTQRRARTRRDRLIAIPAWVLFI